MEMTGGAAALNRATCMMFQSRSSLGVGDGIADGSRICVRPRRELSGGFRDGGHVLYYQTSTTRMRREKEVTAMMVSCGGLVTEKKVKKDEKKKFKLLKGLTKDLSMLSQIGLVGEDNGEGISEAAETLLKHLLVMKSKEEELKKKKKKKKRKMEKDMIKAAKGADCESSSESNDSPCEEVVDLGSLRMMRSSTQCKATKGHSDIDSADLTLPSIPLQSEEGASLIQANGFENLGLTILEKENSNLNLCNEAVKRELNTSCNPVIAAEKKPKKKVEVCMGGKCKKSGAVQLVEEFEKVVGEGCVVGCKCMGRCRDGPNVRVVSSSDDGNGSGKIQEPLLSPPPLCIGVGLEDVAVVVANFLPGNNNSNSSSVHVGLATAAST